MTQINIRGWSESTMRTDTENVPEKKENATLKYIVKVQKNMPECLHMT